ncbi:ABC transporter permease [Candidatus Acetothermia bacterium]|nr:ABC transporter permease [Candidatus Acetothermia bacterium]
MKAFILAKYTSKDLFRDKTNILWIVAVPAGLVVLRNLAAREMLERAFGIAAIVLMFMLIIGCTGVGLAILDMRRSGTFKRILIMPISKTGYFLGMALDLFGKLGIMVGIIFIMMFIYRITIPGSWVDLLIVLLVAVLFSVALGLNYATLSKSVFATIGLGMATGLALFNFADWHSGGRFAGTGLVETIGDHNPVYHLLRMMLGIIFDGAPLGHYHPEVITIFLWIVGLFLTSVALYHWRVEKML